LESPKAFGPFEVRGELGRGAGGVVYLAWNADDERSAAVKLYNVAPKDATAAISRVKRDAQAAGALGHPNIAAVLGVGDHGGWPWVATEFVPGVSLAQVLRGRALLPIERVLDLWRQMCEGLAHAHREGVLHLDLKPADVRLAPTGEVKLVDFGSWHLKALEHGRPGPADAGLHYRAPELLTGRRPDHRADIFSVAAIVYELVAYRKAFPGDSTTDVVRGLTRCEPDLACLPRSPFTPGFERVLALSLARSPESRHPSFEEVHADLVQLVRETAPRLRSQTESSEVGPPEREELLASVTRARAEDRLEDALEGCRKLLERDSEDEAARRAMSEVESVLLEREVDALVGMALAHAADGQLALATGIAEKVERLAPWSPRYLQLQVYLDEEGVRHHADALVTSAREHLAAGRVHEARASARTAIAIMPGHPQAARLVQDLGAEAPPVAKAAAPATEAVAPAPGPKAAAPAAPPAPAPKVVPPATEAVAPADEASAPGASAAPDPRMAEAVSLSATALQHFMRDEHVRAREVVERALALDPANRRALELQRILRALG
jgi:serine/threonine protein kinase